MSNLRRSLTLLALVVLGSVAGCDSPERLLLAPADVAVSKGTGRVVKRSAVAETQYYEATFDAKGGTLSIGNQGTQIRFPAGALSEPTRITVQRDGAELKFTFGPKGTVFAAGAEPELRISYSDAIDFDEATLQIVYLDASGAIVQELPTTLDGSGKFATARVGHFSVYALASN